MDTQVYENIKTSLKNYFTSLNLSKSQSPNIVGFEPSNPTYPMVVFSEPRNVPQGRYNSRIQTVANLGYRFDIYAKTVGNISKQQLARQLASYCDKFACEYVGLRQVSFNEVQNDGTNGALYHIIMMYSGNYHEQKLNFI